MTLLHRRHIVKTTYFSLRGYLFIALIHRIAAKKSSRKLVRPGNATSCMSMRSALRVVAIPSDGSTDLTGSGGKVARLQGVERLCQ